MRKLAFIGAVIFATAMGCSDNDDDGTVTPTPLPQLNVSTTLNGGNEVPSNASTATGDVTGTLDQDNRILKLNITYSDSAIADTTASDSLKAFIPTGWHIHKAPIDSAGAVVIDLGSTFTSPFVFTDTLTAEQVKDLKDGKYYLNIHTANHPTGEIRGQLKAEEAN